MISSNNSANFNIDKIVIVPSSTSGTGIKFKIESITDACRNSGTSRIHIDACIPREIRQFIPLSNTISFVGATQGLNNIPNPYFEICGANDYLIVQDAKTNVDTILLTNDYGMFVCAYLEGSKPMYFPNRDQLKKGKIYFLEKIFKKNINNRIWRLLNK